MMKQKVNAFLKTPAYAGVFVCAKYFTTGNKLKKTAQD